MRLSRGALVQFHDAFTARYAVTGFEVIGTEGPLVGRNVMTQRPVGTVALHRDGEEVDLPIVHENLYERSVRCFNAAVREEGEPAAAGEDGYRLLAIALAARESAASGSRVNLQW